MNVEAVVVTGWHSGENPSPGPGIARSVKAAFPDLKIIAVDYSPAATGLYGDVPDERIVMPRWDDCDLERAAQEILRIVEENDAVLISGLDLETSLLARTADLSGGRLLIPPAGALALAGKPALEAARILGVLVPETEPYRGLAQATEFADRHGWPVVVKGARYEAVQAWNPLGLGEAARRLSGTWSEAPLVQRSIAGAERSVAFSAHGGRLLAACGIRKSAQTALGKVWSAKVEQPSQQELDALARFVRESGWTGGGEVELIEEGGTGIRYLIDLNPRFPAWVYGAALCGHNLPGALVAAVAGRELPRAGGACGFTREIVEVPTGPEYPHDGVAAGHVAGTKALTGRVVHAPHPSGMPALAARMRPAGRDDAAPHVDAADGCLLEGFAAELEGAVARIESEGVPFVRVVSWSRLRERAHAVLDIADELAAAHRREVSAAYSVKTNPDPRVVGEVTSAGMGVEAITLEELASAQAAAHRNCPFAVLNGPGKWRPAPPGAPARRPDYVNCDSVEDLRTTLDELAARGWGRSSVGIRVSPLAVDSRFGVNLDDYVQFRDACRLLRDLRGRAELGVQFHYVQSALGADGWTRELGSALGLAGALAESAGVEFSFLDLGGGFRFADMGGFRDLLDNALGMAGSELGSARSVIVEPGKLVVGGCMALVARVVETRSLRGRRAAVASSDISALPDAASYARQVAWRGPGMRSWRLLGDGDDAILGSICMEHDVLRNYVELPMELSRGDYLAFFGAGAYDASMAFRFGRGA